MVITITTQNIEFMSKKLFQATKNYDWIIKIYVYLKLKKNQNINVLWMKNT